MVDTGASYTIVPPCLLKDIGVSPIDKISLMLAHGQTVEHYMGEARAIICGRGIYTLLVLDADHARALYGPTPSRIRSLENLYMRGDIASHFPSSTHPVQFRAVPADQHSPLVVRDVHHDFVQDSLGLGEGGLGVGVVGTPHYSVDADDIP